MSYVASWKLTAVAIALTAFPLVAGAQTAPPPSTGGQQAPPQSQTPPPQPQTQSPQPPTQTQTPPVTADQVRQVALQHLTLARQALADMTKLPAASHLEGQPRSDVNQLITNFNALITAGGADWRAAYDRVQQNLTSLLGPEAVGEGQPPASAVGTSGTATTGGAAPLDPAIASKLSEVRQHVDEFGRTVGVSPGQSAAQAAPTGTSGGAVSGEEAMRSVDQMGAVLDRVLGQSPPDSPTVSVRREDLQQLRQLLDQLRQAIRR